MRHRIRWSLLASDNFIQGLGVGGNIGTTPVTQQGLEVEVATVPTALEVEVATVATQLEVLAP